MKQIYELFAKISNPITVFLAVVVLFVIFRRRLYREFPWFTIYIGYIVAFTFILYLVYLTQSEIAHMFGYYFGNCITVVLAFMVILEVWRNVLHDYESIRKIGEIALLVLAALVVAVAFLIPRYASSLLIGPNRELILSMQLLQRSVRLIQVGLLVGLFAFSSYFGLTWRNQNFGIALGYGLYAAVNLCETVAKGYFWQKDEFFTYIVGMIDGVAYQLTLILWATYLWRADRGQTSQPLPSGGDAELEEWKDALKPLVKK